ncbi:helix-turn-helix domain-containing protein [Streptomyces sp. NPDC051567]|uniref:helix-turn-helix domain-containing protein n=1 Tax=Streptomyces sp. NPDC051567 TaxID=3365660 RepID=UPI0037A72F5D
MTQKRATPTLKRRRVGSHLRRYREDVPLKSGDAAKLMSWDITRLTRIERGLYRISAEEVRALAKAYGVTDQAAVDVLASAAEEPPDIGWWTPFRDAGAQDLLDYIAAESEAESIRIWTPTNIPALLQTPAYTRELMSTSVDRRLRGRLERLVALRMARQQVLTRPGEPVTCRFLVPEYAFYGQFKGGGSVIKDQLRRLFDASYHENVEIRVVPLSTMPHGGHFAFTLLTFPHPWRPLLSVDNQQGGMLLDDPAEFETSEAMFAQIASVALPVEETRELITKHLEGTNK